MIEVNWDIKFKPRIYAYDLDIGDTFVFIGEENCIYQKCNAGAVCIATASGGYTNNYVGNIIPDDGEKYKSCPVKKLKCELSVKYEED